MIGCTPAWMCISLGFITAIVAVVCGLLGSFIFFRALAGDEGFPGMLVAMLFIFLFWLFLIVSYQVWYAHLLDPASFTEVIP